MQRFQDPQPEVVAGVAAVRKPAEKSRVRDVHGMAIAALALRSDRDAQTIQEVPVSSMTRYIVCAIASMCIGMTTACAPTAERRAPGEFVDDAALTARVKTALVNEKNMNAGGINVNTYRGEVILSGFVENAEMIRRAGAIARGVAGVRAVKNDLHVAPKR